MLDVDLLRSFVAVADTQSFTAAADRLGASQSAVSMRIKKLEERIGRSLLDRTPRTVALSAFGAGFLDDARRLVAAHDDVFRKARAPDSPALTLTIGISEHAGGLTLGPALRAMRAALPDIRLRLVTGFSSALQLQFEERQLDIAIIRRHPQSRGGRLLYRDDLAWWAAPNFAWDVRTPLPFCSIAQPCLSCQAARMALDEAGIAWIDTFITGSVSALQAATAAGLGVSCLGLRHTPAGSVQAGDHLGLPSLPESAVVMLDRAASAMERMVIDRIGDIFAEVSQA